MTRSCVRVQRVKSLISPGNRGKKAFNNVPMRPLGCTEQYNWKHNRAAAISFTWALLQYKINFWCPRDPLLILRCVIKPSEAYEYHNTAHWLASYWKMCTRCNTRDCTSGSADVNKLLCETPPPELITRDSERPLNPGGSLAKPAAGSAAFRGRFVPLTASAIGAIAVFTLALQQGDTGHLERWGNAAKMSTRQLIGTHSVFTSCNEVQILPYCT